MEKRGSRKGIKSVNKSIKISKISRGWSFTLCLLIVLVVAGFASIFTATGINSPWYNYVKPTITPPSYVFSIVWTVVYLLLALSMYLSLTSAQERQKRIVAFLFALNLFFNGIWSFLFFGLQNTKAAFLDIILLFLSTLAIMTIMAETNKNVSWLLLPYALWLIFAGILNYLVLFMQMM